MNTSLIKDKLSVVIVSYNSGLVIEHGLAEILGGSFCNVCVVDNASTDGSGERLKALYPNVDVCQLDRNIGYGRAANIGIER